MGATAFSRATRRAGLLAAMIAWLVSPALGQQREAGDKNREAQAEKREARSEEPGTKSTRRDVGAFLLGGATALGAHEGAHVLFDVIVGARPRVERVHFGPLPFFAITHESGLPPRQEFAISSAGFWAQHLANEIVLTRHPRLRDEDGKFLKGVVAFDVLASAAYGVAAMAHAGPFERDTRGMADSLRVNETWVGAAVLVPAALDAWRYFHPGSKRVAWASRVVKAAMVGLVFRAR